MRPLDSLKIVAMNYQNYLVLNDRSCILFSIKNEISIITFIKKNSFLSLITARWKIMTMTGLDVKNIFIVDFDPHLKTPYGYLKELSWQSENVCWYFFLSRVHILIFNLMNIEKVNSFRGFRMEHYKFPEVPKNCLQRCL